MVKILLKNRVLATDTSRRQDFHPGDYLASSYTKLESIKNKGLTQSIYKEVRVTIKQGPLVGLGLNHTCECS